MTTGTVSEIRVSYINKMVFKESSAEYVINRCVSNNFLHFTYTLCQSIILALKKQIDYVKNKTYHQQ